MFTYKGFTVMISSRTAAGTEEILGWTAVIRLASIKVAEVDGLSEGAVRFKAHEAIDELLPGMDGNGKSTFFSRS